MLPRASVYYVKLILESALVLVFVLSTSSMKQCKRKNIPNLGLKLCQLKCNENNLCSDYEYHIETLPCHLSRNESRKNEKQEGHMKLPRNLSNVQTGSCASETCRLAQQCLKTPPRKAICEQDKKQNNPRKHKVDKQDSFAHSELHIACRKGNFARVRRILSLDLININSRDEKHGRTPLMVAAKEGHCRIFSFLVTKGANMSQVDNDGKNILHWAYEGGHENMVGCVLPQLGVNINKRHPILQAALKGKRDVLEFLLCMGANVSQVDYSGNNVLHNACKGGHVGMVQYLLSQGSLDINGKRNNGVTPLILSVQYRHMDIFELLLCMGANASHVDNYNNTVLHYASRTGHVKMVKYILSKVKIGVNSRGIDGQTPLMDAVHYGHVKVFRQLVRKGAHTHLVDDNGNNLLHLAILGAHMTMVKYILVRNMVDIKAKNKNKKTAAMIAKCCRKLSLYKLLVSWGCPVK